MPSDQPRKGQLCTCDRLPEQHLTTDCRVPDSERATTTKGGTMNKAEHWYTGCDIESNYWPGVGGPDSPMLLAATSATDRRNRAKYGDRYDGTGLLRPESARD